MNKRLLSAAIATLGAISVAASGCSSSTSKPASSGRALSGSITVFGAASLTGAFNTAKASLSASNPGLHLTYEFAGSNTLVTQIEQGAPADVFASADAANMQKLVAAGLVDPPVTFARNQLEIAVAPGNPKHVTGLADLSKPGLRLVLEAPGVPAGDYARQALNRLHLSVSPVSLETDVKSAIAKVSSGEADATVVYVTDVKAAGPTVSGVKIPDAVQPVITYPIAVVKATRNADASQAFVDSAVSGDVQRALEAAGFLPPR